MISSEENINNKNIELHQSGAVKDSGLIKYGYYNIDTENITVFFNHTINSEIKFTIDKNKWQNNYKLLLNEIESYGGINNDKTKLLLKEFLNYNESKINAKYTTVNEDPEVDEQNKPKEITIYKYSQLGKGQLHEAILVKGLPYFVKYDNISQTHELVENIPEIYRVLRPPKSEEYPYIPYSFKSLEELEFYIQKAKQITKDELFETSKKIFTMFIDQDKHTIVLLSADAIWTYFQDLFSITHYFEAVGGNDVGKTSVGYTFQYTGYRVIRGTSISGANYIRILKNVEPGQCVIVEDEGDRISEDIDKVNILKSGYEYDSRVPKTNMNTSDQLPDWYLPYCYKMILAEKSLREYKVPGLVDRTFTNKCRPGNVKYSIKEVVSPNPKKSPRLQRLYDQLLSFRKLMLCYRLVHYHDQLTEIETGLKNRDNELCKGLLQFLYGTEALQEVKETLEVFVKRRRSRKKASLEAALYPIIKKYVFKEVGLDSGQNTFGDVKAKKKLIKVAFTHIWEYIINGGIDGHYDEKKSRYGYETKEYGTLYLNSLPKTIRDKFTAEIKTQNYGSSLLFDIDELERFEDQYGDIQLNEDNVIIEVKEYVSEEKGDDYDDFGDFLGVRGDILDKKFGNTRNNHGDKIDSYDGVQE
jgi:hypothetical protein